KTAQMAQCLTNLRQQGTMYYNYLTENDFHIPFNDTFSGMVAYGGYGLQRSTLQTLLRPYINDGWRPPYVDVSRSPTFWCPSSPVVGKRQGPGQDFGLMLIGGDWNNNGGTGYDGALFEA